jgi:hypothetical protein
MCCRRADQPPPGRRMGAVAQFSKSLLIPSNRFTKIGPVDGNVTSLSSFACATPTAADSLVFSGLIRKAYIVASSDAGSSMPRHGADWNLGELADSGQPAINGFGPNEREGVVQVRVQRSRPDVSLRLMERYGSFITVDEENYTAVRF